MARAPKMMGRRFHAVDDATRWACSPALGCQTTPPEISVGAFDEIEPGRCTTTSVRSERLISWLSCSSRTRGSTPEPPSCCCSLRSARFLAPTRSTVPANDVLVRRNECVLLSLKFLNGPLGPLSSVMALAAPPGLANGLVARTHVRLSRSSRGPTTVQPAFFRSSTRSCWARSGIWCRASSSRPTPARTTPLPFCWASTPTAIVTWQALQRSSERTTAANAGLLRRADNQQRALDVVADLVRDRAEEESAGAGHAFVADDQQVVVAVVSDLDQGSRGITIVDPG